MDVLTKISYGNFQVTHHALLQMKERNISYHDIRQAGKNGKITSSRNNKYKIRGTDLDGAPLTLIAIAEQGILIITVY